MIASLLQFIFGIATTLLGALFLLRAWLWYWALSSRHPLVQLSSRATDWFTAPVSRVVKPQGGFDWPSILGAFLTAVLAVLLYRLTSGWPATPVGLVIAPFATMLRWVLEMVSWGTLIWAVLSWVNPSAPMTYTLALLIDPFLRPVRRVMPTVKGIDFSPFVIILAANALLIFVVPLSRGVIVL